MDIKYKWATEEIYPSDKAWQDEFNYIKEKLDLSCFKGTLDKKENFIKFMKAQEKITRVLEKLSVYAMMKHDENTKISLYDGMVNQITSVYAEFSSKIAFVVPELTKLSTKKLNEYILDKDLSDYSYFLKTLLKRKEHVLSEDEERLLALGSEAMSSFREIFTKIDDADLPLSTFTYKGEKITLTHGTYGVLMHEQDRALRKKAFNEYYKAYYSLINTISSTYYGSVKKDVFYARARKYSSALEMALSNEDVDKKVYENLISSVHTALPLLHKYMQVKKKELGLSKLRMFDVYCPIVENAEIKLDYEDAYDLVVKGLSVLGKDYVDLLEKARRERWLDVYEGKGKRSGAYSVAVYDTHPYVLLNYQKTTHDVFTIAHEMGHSIHSYFSNKNQPYEKADYKIFVAEVASTVNEVLLIKYLLKNAKDDKLKKYLLSYLLEMIRTTLFRQTQFAEFEVFSHSSVEKGIPLTKDMLSDEYLRLNSEYYGPAVEKDENIKYEWARIPHFYRAFYVYKYATGIISALSIANRITTQGKEAVEDYFKFLSSGNSDSPTELLKIAGVDLEDKTTYERAFNEFENALNEFISL
ncbi:MAG: oligoendopeptidase F [Clostridia bacterium]|nr:oligoendopeptidase F [Clostridia bacterium]